MRAREIEAADLQAGDLVVDGLGADIERGITSVDELDGCRVRCSTDSGSILALDGRRILTVVR